MFSWRSHKENAELTERFSITENARLMQDLPGIHRLVKLTVNEGFPGLPCQKCFKYDDSNKKKLCKMFVNILCNMQACDNIFRKLSERMGKLSQDLLINYMLHILHKLPYDRRRKAYRLSQMIKRSFQHTAFFLWPVNSPSSKDVQSGALYRNLINLQLHPTTTLFPKVSRGPTVAHSRLFEF